MEFSGEMPSRKAFSAPVSRQNTSHRRYRRERTLSAFPGWFFSRSPFRVSNRQTQRRIQSEPPQHLSRGQGSGSLPAAPQNRPIVSQNTAPYESNSTNQRVNGHGHQTHSRRLQSLPARKPRVANNGESRPIKSAPDNGQPLHTKANNFSPYPPAGNGHRPAHAFINSPPHARSRMADKESGADLHQKTHGIATRSYEETYLRSHKFATSWARVRAENPTFMENVPGQMIAEKQRDDSQSPERTPKYHPTTGSPSSRTEDHPTEHRKKETHHQSRGRMPFRRRKIKKQKHSGSRSPQASKPATRHENQSAPEDTEESGSDLEKSRNEDSDGAPESNDVGTKRSPRRGPWIDSVVVPASNKPPPKLDARRCKHDLTFKPTVNTDQVVTKAYTDQDGIIVKDRVYFDDNLMSTDDEDGYVSPGNESGIRSTENSPDRTGKERMLSKREARIYIKMMNVYGSEAFKNQRKEWFVKKLNEAQEAKSKYEEQEKRDLQKKRDYDKIKQQRQLNYVRNKFRRQQVHRFQTQYVTARVLEYERANRHTYGLPEDFEDLAYLLKEDDEEESIANPVETDNVNSKGKNSNTIPAHKKNQKNATQPVPNKKQGAKSNKQRAQEARESEALQREQERLTRVRQNQSAWYAQTDASPARQESPMSHGTSGYESEKSPSEQNGQIEGESAADQKLDKSGVKHEPDQRKKGARQLKDNVAENRLASQKHIYEKRPPNRVQQRAAMIAEGKVNQRQKKDETGINRNDDFKPTQQSYNRKAAVGGEQQLDESTKPDQTGAPSKTSEHRKVNDIDPKKTTEENEKKLKAHPSLPASQRVQKDKKDVALRQDASPSKGTLVNTREKGIPPTKNKSGESTQANQAENSKSKTSEETKGRASSSSKQPIYSTVAEPRTAAMKSETIKSSNDNTTNKQAINDHQSIITDQQNKQSNLGKATAQISGEFHPSSSKTTVKDKPSSTQSRPEDETPINIKRVPLAGTISKENAPQTFGVSENKLEHMVSEQKRQTPNGIQSTSTPSKPTSKDATSMKNSVVKDKARKDTAGHNKPTAVTKVNEPLPNRLKTTVPSAKSAKSNDAKKAKPKQNESLADKMFNIKTGPTWNPHSKVPKMEGIDTVVVTGKDGKGRIVKKKRNVNDVVREASDLLQAAEKDAPRSKVNSKLRMSRSDSPAMTLGSDFDVDDDEEPDDDIFERLRRKYNIKIDSDDEDDDVNAR